MSPSRQRSLRELRPAALVALTLVVIAGLAQSTHRLEQSRSRTQPSVCSRLVYEAFGLDAARTPDSVLLGRLLAHRSRCTPDANYVDQARRLMLNMQRVGDARALLVDAERSHAFTGDQLAVQRAWVDLEESREALLEGDVKHAASLRARALGTTRRLRAAWPEWETPYVILGELERNAPIESEGSPGVAEDQYALARAAHGRVTTGAYVRSLSSERTIVAVCAVAALGLLAFGVAMSGVLTSHGLRRMPTESVADVKAGYVALAGTLHLPPRADAVMGPLSNAPGVWYALETNFGSRRSHSWRARSAQRFLLRDATGEVAIDPSGAVVRTRHVRSQFGSGAIVSRRWETERMLREGDAAYVVGELSHAKSASGVVERAVRVPEDGRRLLVSNYSEAELIEQERIWIWSGALVFALATAALMWGYVQRYGVPVMP